MHYLIVSDAWHPQVNGVVRTLENLKSQLEKSGHRVTLITPEGFKTLAMPFYPEIRLSLARSRELKRKIFNAVADRIHIATEGPLGWTARRICLKFNLSFTTSFHSRFPEMVSARLNWRGLETLGYRILRHFHAPAAAILTPTSTVTQRLHSLGLPQAVTWTRGTDREIFHPGRRDPKIFDGLKRPVAINVGRVSVEKNLDDFLSMPFHGSKVVVGEGPYLHELKSRYPETHFIGYKRGSELAKLLASADVFVFPSTSDTFGVVMIEALSCGTPVAAYPVEGPIDVITDAVAGILDPDLSKATEMALSCNRTNCVEFVRRFSWERVAEIFEETTVPITGRRSGQTPSTTHISRNAAPS